MGMKANTHLEVPSVNWAIIHTTRAGRSLLLRSQNQQQPVGMLQPSRGSGGQSGHGGQVPLPGGSAWSWRLVVRHPRCSGVLGKCVFTAHMGPRWEVGSCLPGAPREPKSTCVGFY